jgi:hypothetical protein
MRTGSPMNAQFKGNHRLEYVGFALLDSMPLISMSSKRAAKAIVRAIEHGTPHVVLGLGAKLVSFAGGLLPGLVTRALTAVSSRLPPSSDARTKLGRESETPLTRSVLTVATQRAALRNNEC